MLWASNQQWRAEAKGQRASEPQLSLGTSWGWERASQGSTPFYRQAGRAGPEVREAQLGAGIMGHCDSCSLCGSHLDCLLPPVLSGSLPRQKSSRGILRGFLRFHGAQNLHVAWGRATPHFLRMRGLW